MPTENKASPKERFIELDILRGFAMLTVVASHVTSVAIENLRAGRAHLILSIIHGAYNYAVPVFVLVASLLSAYKADNRPVSVLPYYKKKLIRLVLPYLVWTLIYILFNLAVNKLHFSDLLIGHNWYLWISQGRAYDHLYYLVIICQFHLLFPLLIMLARLVKDKPFWAFIIVFTGHNVFYWLNKLWFADIFPYFQSSFFWYFSVSFLGLYIGLNFNKFRIWLRKNIKWLTVVCVVFAAAFLFCRYLLYENVRYHNYIYFTIRLVFVTSLPVCLIIPAQNHRLERSWVGRSLLWVGRYSLGIYLAHPLLNFYLRKWVKSRNILLLAPTIVAAVIVFTIICGFFTKLLEKFRPTAWLVGATRKQ